MYMRTECCRLNLHNLPFSRTELLTRCSTLEAARDCEFELRLFEHELHENFVRATAMNNWSFEIVSRKRSSVRFENDPFSR